MICRRETGLVPIWRPRRDRTRILRSIVTRINATSAESRRDGHPGPPVVRVFFGTCECRCRVQSTQKHSRIESWNLTEGYRHDIAHAPSQRGHVDGHSRRIARGLAASLCRGMLVASGSVVMSFEPSPQDDVKRRPSQATRSRASNAKQGAGGDVATRKGAGEGKRLARRTRRTRAMAKDRPGPLPERPARAVTPPTMTSADLDGLIKQFLTATAPKVEPATADHRRRVRAPHLFRRDRASTHAVQVESFLHDHSKDKRARLIDTLLASPEYARNWANYWREVIAFHATNENLNRVRFDALEDWLAKRLQANTPGIRSSRG